jgi:hypothetical protein
MRLLTSRCTRRPLTTSAKAPVSAKAGGEAGETIVYITRTGAKYHRAGCRSLSRSSIPIKLSEAVAKGYTACRPAELRK